MILFFQKNEIKKQKTSREGSSRENLLLLLLLFRAPRARLLLCSTLPTSLGLSRSLRKTKWPELVLRCRALMT